MTDKPSSNLKKFVDANIKLRKAAKKDLISSGMPISHLFDAMHQKNLLERLKSGEYTPGRQGSNFTVEAAMYRSAAKQFENNHKQGQVTMQEENKMIAVGQPCAGSFLMLDEKGVPVNTAGDNCTAGQTLPTVNTGASYNPTPEEILANYPRGEVVEETTVLHPSVGASLVDKSSVGESGVTFDAALDPKDVDPVSPMHSITNGVQSMLSKREEVPTGHNPQLNNQVRDANMFSDAVERRGKQFLADARFLRQFIGKKVPRQAVVKYTKAMADCALYIAHDYIVDSNPTYDQTSMIFDKKAREAYLKKITCNPIVHDMVFLPRGIAINVLSTGNATLTYQNGDQLHFAVSAIAPGQPLSMLNHLVELEIQARRMVEDAEQVILSNQHPYDKRLGDLLIQFCFTAQCFHHGYIALDTPEFLNFIMGERLDLSPGEFIEMFSNRPRVLVEVMMHGIGHISKIAERFEKESIKSAVLPDNISEQTGVSTRMHVNPDDDDDDLAASDERFCLPG